MMAWEPSCGADRLERELPIMLEVAFHSFQFLEKKTYPRNEPTGVRAVETM